MSYKLLSPGLFWKSRQCGWSIFTALEDKIAMPAYSAEQHAFPSWNRFCRSQQVY